MIKAKILKTKFYIYRLTEDHKRIVRSDLGAFATESKAWGSMFQRAPEEKQSSDWSSPILMERKPEFKRHNTVNGKDILKYPHIYLVPETIVEVVAKQTESEV